MAVKKSDIVKAVTEVLEESADQDLDQDQIAFLSSAVGEKLVDEVDGVYDDGDDADPDFDSESDEDEVKAWTNGRG